MLVDFGIAFYDAKCDIVSNLDIFKHILSVFTGSQLEAKIWTFLNCSSLSVLIGYTTEWKYDSIIYLH